MTITALLFAQVADTDALYLTKEKCLHTFLVDRISENRECTNPLDVLYKIGITQNSLKHCQLNYLLQLNLNSIFPCLQLFIEWVDKGLYDFFDLPLSMKACLSEGDLQYIDNYADLRSRWTGTVLELKSKVKHLIDMLKMSEIDITKSLNVQLSEV